MSVLWFVVFLNYVALKTNIVLKLKSFQVSKE